MEGVKQRLAALVAVALSLSLLSACGPSRDSDARGMTAKEMVTSDIYLSSPAGPSLISTPRQESPIPSEPATHNPPQPAASAQPDQAAETFSPDQKMQVAPFKEPKRVNEFSEQGAVNLVAYYIYATYYSFVARDTALMEQAYDNRCDKCLQMQKWANRFITDNEVIETGIPTTTVLDVSAEKTEDGVYLWVVAENQEPAVLGKDRSGTQTGYDPSSDSVAMYRVEFVNGHNTITGIFTAPKKYQK